MSHRMLRVWLCRLGTVKSFMKDMQMASVNQPVCEYVGVSPYVSV